MTYAAYETSQYGGAPIELHTVRSITGDKIWRITAGAQSKLHPDTGYNFESVPGLERAEMIISSSGKKKEMNIVIPLDHEVAQFFFSGVPSTEVRWTIERFHATDPDLQVEQYWDGYVFEPDYDLENNQCKFIGRPDPSQADSVMAVCFGQQCQYNTFDSNCGLVEGEWEVNSTITSISSNGLTVAVSDIGSLEDNYFRAGAIRLIKDGVVRNVMIRESNQTSSELIIYEQFPNLQVGDVVKLLPGCSKDPVLCHSRFNNIENALWFDMPTKNIYTNNQGLKGI